MISSVAVPMDETAISGMIFDIQKFSIHDGPGIRTTVFMKGCPLRCRWCHNPESITRQPHLSFDSRRCIGCGVCFKVCPNGAHCLENGAHAINRAVCRLCGICVENCHAKALETVGQTITVKEVMAKVLQDLDFYRDSGGGLTISGGEPTLQPEFCMGLLESARNHGIHTAIETSGFCDWNVLSRMRRLCGLFLYDLKSDPEHHETITGVPFDLIGENLRRLHDAKARIWIRLPVVPGLNDSPSRFQHAARMLRIMPNIEIMEVIPYHPMGTEKTSRMGLEDAARVVIASPSADQVQSWIRQLSDLGVCARAP